MRPLVGLEGAVAPRLRLAAWAGPSYHTFTAERRAGTARNRTIPYFETTTTWTATPADTATAALRHQLWLGSGGRSAYRELKLDASWMHRFAGKTEASLRADWLHGDFGGFAAAPRHDSVYSISGIVARPLDRGFRAELGLTREWAQTYVPHTEGRAYHRWLTSLSFARAW